MPSPPQFDDAFRRGLRTLLTWRRDVRRFRPAPLPRGTVERLIELAALAPSVGLSQPWRFVPNHAAWLSLPYATV
jgi:5,6-dimethylbenzimidazole synthase